MGRWWWLWIASALIGCLVACDDNDASTDAGGTGGMDAGRDASTLDASTTDARTADATMDSGTTVSWYATKTTLDVWWQGVPVHDPGRDHIDIYTLTEATGDCDNPASETTVRVCGITLPTYTSDVACNAYQLTIPDVAWDSPQMPTFRYQPTHDDDAGGHASHAVAALLGIDLGGNADWPAPQMTTTLNCGAHTGVDCFPDHDDDSFPGITAHFRIDSATYTGPYDTGRCTQGRSYTHRGAPTSVNIGAGAGGWGPEIQADRLRLGIGVRLGALGSGNNACSLPDATASAPYFHMRAIACAVDPLTLPPGGGGFIALPREPRLDAMDYTCAPAEAAFVDQHLPQFQVLGAGERPGNSMRPNGWIVAGRDIDTRVSEGTKVVTVQLDNDTDGGTAPTCAQVRAALTGM